MKSIWMIAILIGVINLILNIAILFGMIQFFPDLAMEYYNPVFRSEDDRNWMFYVHPFLLAFALTWFWHRFRKAISGEWLTRGLKLGLSYLIIAMIPSMWITFSAMDIGATMVLTWLAYGFFQSIVAGWILAKMAA